MKTPPLLLGAGLLFWGWQTGHLVEGAVMAAVLEGAQLIKARWDFTDEDFRRIWTFCALLLLGAALYAFTSTGGPGEFRGFFQNPSLATERNVGNASARTVASLIRWLPMIFFLFMAAQAFSSREGIPPETISVIMRLRWQKARKLGQPLPAARSVNISYPYFMLCLFAASFHTGEDETFYWGLCPLLAWALWPQRSRRFGVAIWAGALAAAMVLGYGGQRGVGRVYRLLENYNAQWFIRGIGGGADPMQSKTSLGQIGWLKGSSKIVIRLEPKDGSRAPTLLREASYRTWKAQTWYSDIARDKFETVYEETNHTTWVLLSGKTNSAAVNLACYLPGGSAAAIAAQAAGGWRTCPPSWCRRAAWAPSWPKGRGWSCSMRSTARGRRLIRRPVTNEDLNVPPKETYALDQVIAELQLKQQSRRDRCCARSARSSRTRTSSATAPGRDSESSRARMKPPWPASSCAPAAVTANTSPPPPSCSCAELGIPARYAVGYAVHEASGRKYVVRQRDAHAWCLVWNPTSGTWQDFDTTPASWVAAEAGRASPMQFLSDCWSRIVFEIAKFRWGQTHLRQYLLWGAGAGAGAVALPDYLSQPAAAARCGSRETLRAGCLGRGSTRNSIRWNGS